MARRIGFSDHAGENGAVELQIVIGQEQVADATRPEKGGQSTQVVPIYVIVAYATKPQGGKEVVEIDKLVFANQVHETIQPESTKIPLVVQESNQTAKSRLIHSLEVFSDETVKELAKVMVALSVKVFSLIVKVILVLALLSLLYCGRAQGAPRQFEEDKSPVCASARRALLVLYLSIARIFSTIVQRLSRAAA
jgi:hypothetical protein